MMIEARQESILVEQRAGRGLLVIALALIVAITVTSA
jgi:hypothetical protein